MSSELERRIQDKLPGLRLDRATKREMREVVRDTGVTIFKADAAATVTRHAAQAAADVTSHAMQTVNGLVDEARQLAGGDPVKQALFVRMVTDYTVGVSKKTTDNILGWRAEMLYAMVIFSWSTLATTLVIGWLTIGCAIFAWGLVRGKPVSRVIEHVTVSQGDATSVALRSSHKHFAAASGRSVVDLFRRTAW